LVIALSSLIDRLGENIMREGKYLKFRNERRKFVELVEAIASRFPRAELDDGTLAEPFRSLAFLVTVGQRPATSLIILEIMLEVEGPLHGREIGEELAKKLKVSPKLTTKGGNYMDRVGDLVATFVKTGILEPVYSEKAGYFVDEGFRIRESAVAEVRAFMDCITLEDGVLCGLRPISLEDLFMERFDRKIEYVVKSGSEERQRFCIGKIISSLLDLRVGASFELALRVIEEAETELKTGMKTLEIQSLLYNTLKKYDDKAAENYRLTYPEILSMTMNSGEMEIVNYSLVKTLISEEVQLKLTSDLLNNVASTVYNVITRNPSKYQDERAVRKYIDALVLSEFFDIGVDRASFIENHLKRAKSALEGCRSSLQSDLLGPASDLFGLFLESITLVALTQFGYLPFRNFRRNVDLISNLLRQDLVKKQLQNILRLDEKHLSEFQSLKAMMQRKDTASKKHLEKMVEKSETLIDLCATLLQQVA